MQVEGTFCERIIRRGWNAARARVRAGACGKGKPLFESPSIAALSRLLSILS